MDVYENSIVWFRNDLRIHDNETLSKAHHQSKTIIPVYCIEPRLFIKNEFGNRRIGKFRAKFLLESITDLRNNFHKKKGKLLVFLGNPEEIIPQLALKFQCKKVFAQKEIAFEEIQIEQTLEKELWKNSITLELIWGQTLFHPDDLPFPTRDIPDIFTQFRKKIESETSVRKVLQMPDRFHISDEVVEDAIPNLKKLGLLDDDCNILRGGENNAITRLNYYLFENKLIETYKESRNQLLGLDYSSKLSPWLSLGCISPRLIYWEIKKYENLISKNDSTYWLVFELLWRDYFKFSFKKYGNRFFNNDGIKSINKTGSFLNHELYRNWKEGNTGFPFVDACMRELKQTGFLSNRGRQNVASFFIHYLKLPWLKGAEYFEEMLLDYDVCSNYGNWAYLAGVGNDPRENRIFNIAKQARDYDAKAEFIKYWCPELQSYQPDDLHTMNYYFEKNLK